MLKKQLCVPGTVMKNRVTATVQKLPNVMIKDRRSTSFNFLIYSRQIVLVSDFVFAPMKIATGLRHQISSFAHYYSIVKLLCCIEF